MLNYWLNFWFPPKKKSPMLKKVTFHMTDWICGCQDINWEWLLAFKHDAIGIEIRCKTCKAALFTSVIRAGIEFDETFPQPKKSEPEPAKILTLAFSKDEKEGTD